MGLAGRNPDFPILFCKSDVGASAAFIEVPLKHAHSEGCRPLNKNTVKDCVVVKIKIQEMDALDSGMQKKKAFCCLFA